MRQELRKSGARGARDARLALSVLLALSLLSNLALSVSLSGRESMTVLVPSVSGPVWEVGDGWAGRRYLEDTGRTVVSTLLTLTPENFPHVREAAARMSHPSARGAIGAWLAAEAERMARHDLASAFYPDAVSVNPDALEVEARGELVTWIGREEASRAQKTYRLAFRLDGGRLGLLRFEDLEEGS